MSKQRSRLASAIRNRDSVMLHSMRQARRPQSVAVATTDAEVTAPDAAPSDAFGGRAVAAGAGGVTR